METSADIIIIGGGITGCALLYELSKHQLGKILLLEKNSIASGTTGKAGGVIRKFNHSSQIFPLASQSFDYYMRFAPVVGASCGFRPTGCSYLFNKLTPTLQAQLQALEQIGHFVEKEKGPRGTILMHEKSAGCIDPVLTCQAWVQAASHQQGLYQEKSPVRTIWVENGQVQGVQTRHHKLRAKRVVVAGGAGSYSLLEQLGVQTHLSVKYFQYQLYSCLAHPLAAPFLDMEADLYLVPLPDGNVLAGSMDGDFPLVNDRAPKRIPKAHQYHMQKRLLHRFPQFAKEKLLRVGLALDAFANAPGIIGEVTGVQGLYVASGWSGGGIKIAPAVAQRLVQVLKKEHA